MQHCQSSGKKLLESQALEAASGVMSKVEHLLEGVSSNVDISDKDCPVAADERRYSEGLFESVLLADDRRGEIWTL